MDTITKYIAELQQVLGRIPQGPIYLVIAELSEARLRGKRIFIMGNGGSAATASHFVCDLAKTTHKEGCPDFRVIGLTDNVPMLLAYANDEGYENIFCRQLANLIQPDDLVIGISASGNSRNVIKAIELAKRVNAKTMGFTGFDGGQLGAMVDINIRVPSDCIQQVEDIHLVLEHMIVKALCEEMQSPINLRQAINHVPTEFISTGKCSDNHP